MRCQQSLLLLCFLGSGILYGLRANLSLTIVAMAGSSGHDDVQSFEYDCPVEGNKMDLQEKLIRKSNGEFKWSEKLQGKVLGMFFYGYLLTNILGGRLSEKVGGKIVYGSGVTLSGLLSLITPAAARHSVESFMTVRLIQGMTAGVTFPSLNTLMAQWVPPPERSRFIARALGGSLFGTVVTLASSGWLTSRWGWPYVFYISGLLSLFWCFFWVTLVHDSPASHPSISKEERDHLEMSVGFSHVTVRSPVPWREIMTSSPFWAIIFAHFGCNWGFYALLTELPTYLATVHHLNVKDNGIVSSLPYLCMWIFSILYSNYADGILHTGRASYHSVRKNSSLLSLLIPLLTLLLVSEVGCRSHLVILLISLGLASTGASYTGFRCGFQELAPNYAGTLAGISNTIAAFPGVLAPMATGSIINKEPTIKQWRRVFHLASVIYFITALFYMKYMCVELQSWNSTSRSHWESLRGIQIKNFYKILDYGLICICILLLVLCLCDIHMSTNIEDI